MLAVLLAGLHRAWRTGQADPWDWAMPAALVLAVAGWALARRGGTTPTWAAPIWAAPIWVGAGGAGMALVFCTVTAARAPDMGAASGLLAVAVLAGVAGALLPKRAWGLIVPCLLPVALLLWRGPARPFAPVAERPTLAIVTALPLFWAEPERDGSGQDGTEPQDAPIVAILRTRFTVAPLDDPARLPSSGAKALLLAQPRALTAAQLVAIDRWVRDGGTALVLADPLLRWPSALPLGDRRRAPSVSLLGPLLAHWRILPDMPLEEAEIRHFLPSGALVTLSGAQPGDSLPIVRRIGRGRVVLVADADLIDDRLWLADPARPLDPRAWSADTPALVAGWLGASVPGDRHWMRTRDDVLLALRLALLAGTIWAMSGAALLRRKMGTAAIGTKGENILVNRAKSG